MITGRSDSTLNRGGVRMGTADIYAAVESIPAVLDCVVLGVEQPDGGYWMPLFVQLAPGEELTDELVAELKSAIRTQASPRHVPDEIIAVPGVPHTRTGKRLEVPLKRLFQGVDPARAVNVGAVDDASRSSTTSRWRRSAGPLRRRRGGTVTELPPVRVSREEPCPPTRCQPRDHRQARRPLGSFYRDVRSDAGHGRLPTTVSGRTAPPGGTELSGGECSTGSQPSRDG